MMFTHARTQASRVNLLVLVLVSVPGQGQLKVKRGVVDFTPLSCQCNVQMNKASVEHWTRALMALREVNN